MFTINQLVANCFSKMAAIRLLTPHALLKCDIDAPPRKSISVKRVEKKIYPLVWAGPRLASERLSRQGDTASAEPSYECLLLDSTTLRESPGHTEKAYVGSGQQCQADVSQVTVRHMNGNISVMTPVIATIQLQTQNLRKSYLLLVQASTVIVNVNNKRILLF